MEQRKDIPAFPLAFQEQDASGMPRTEMYAHDGMTLRDYFAARAMQSIRSGPEWQLLEMKTIAAENDGDLEVVIAHFAYLQADAMLAAREK